MLIEFSVNDFEKLREYIYRKCGIALEEDKHYEKVKKILSSRCDSLGAENFRKYFFHLRFEDRSGEEFQNLINDLTVNETYFFRENHQFEVLVNTILPEIHKRKREGEYIRILSSPCSTGEEPYSIALHLLEDDTVVNERDFEIVGIDIDSTVIDKARKGLYSDRSLHALPPNVKSTYFTKKMGYNEISRDLTEAIDFKVCNVFDREEMRRLGKFDVIFSRNMLIYFDDASRKEVAMTFYDILNPNGYVLLGHAEYMSRIVSVFQAKKINDVLVYQK